MEKKNTLLYVIITILCVLVLLLGGYIVYDKLEKNDNELSDKKQDENKNVTKLDDTRDWIYDAEYEKNVTANSYTTVYNNTYYADDIKVPYINVNSTYAKRANNEISQVFDEAIKVYNDGLSNKTSYVDECNYKNYLNGNNLSVVLTYGVGSTDVVHPKYYTYNINLITGNELSYEEVYTLANISSTNIDSKIESAITSVLKERLKDTKNDLSTCINESIDNYKASVNNNTLKYFLSENNKLNVVVKLSIPAGTGEFDTIITVE